MSTTVLSPDLATLAANAAVELDLLTQGEVVDASSIAELTERLEGTLAGDAADTKRLHADTATETVLGRAFTTAGDDPTNILAQLFDRTEQVVQQLNLNSTPQADRQSANRQNLEWLREFCLALSQSASAYRQTTLDMRPPHPHRR